MRGWSCGTHGERGEVHTGFWWGDLWGKGDMEDLGLDSIIIFKCILRYGVYWIDLFGDKEQWRVVVKVVINLLVF